jgi:hypothetical protein
LGGLATSSKDNNTHPHLNSKAPTTYPAHHQQTSSETTNTSKNSEKINNQSTSEKNSNITASNQPITINILEQQEKTYDERFSYPKSELCFDTVSGDIFNNSTQTAIASCLGTVVKDERNKQRFRDHI